MHTRVVNGPTSSGPNQWRIQKILVGGDFKHKTAKSRMSSPKLRMVFWPKSEIQTIFSPKIRCTPKKKKVFTKIESDFSVEIGNSNDFFAQNQMFSKKKRKRSSPKLRVIFRPKSEIQTIFSPKIRCSPKKKRSLPKLRVIFRPDSLRLGWWGGCIPKWSRIIRNRG